MKKFIGTVLTLSLIIALFCVWYNTSDFKKEKENRDSEESTTVSLATLPSPDPYTEDDTTSPLSSSEAPAEETHENTIPEDAKEVTVLWVSDGDTYIVDLDGAETTIRLIGVDTPESVAPDEYLEKSGKENNEEGKIASNVMKEKLPQGTIIYIKIGSQPTDDYGRTLAYAWFSDGTMIEDFLLENGYAVTLTIEPNTEYADHFQKILEKAA